MVILLCTVFILIAIAFASFSTFRIAPRASRGPILLPPDIPVKGRGVHRGEGFTTEAQRARRRWGFTTEAQRAQRRGDSPRRRGGRGEEGFTTETQRHGEE
jgi:hypothetical protein